MNNKGFTLVELLACISLLGLILGIGLYVTRDTLSTSLSTITGASVNEVYDTSEVYILENGTVWIHENSEEYTCVSITDMASMGYFSYEDVASYGEQMVKVYRDSITKVINERKLVNDCE